MSGLPYPPTSLSEGGGLGGRSTIKCLMRKTTCRLAEGAHERSPLIACSHPSAQPSTLACLHPLSTPIHRSHTKLVASSFVPQVRR